MKNRPVVAAVVAVWLGVVGWTTNDASAAEDRPNILWISCEDISPHLGCYGDPHASTPHLDALAKRGVRYDLAFAPAGVCAPCRSTIITGMYQTSIGTHHMRCSATLPDFIQPFTIALRRSGYYCTNNSKKDYQFKEPKATWDESSGKAHWRKRKSADQPFFAVFNFTDCHESGIASDEKYRRVTKGLKKQDPSALTTLPPYYPDTPATRADWARNYDVIAAMDRRVGALLKQLDDDGLRENTIVIFWSDHGVGLPRAKRWLYDSGMRVPLIVAAPAKWKRYAPGPAGSSTRRLVSLMDLGPTTLRLAGLEPLPHMQGRAFLGDGQPAPRRYVFGARDRMDERYDIIRAVRDQRFKYLRNYEPFKDYYQYINTAEKGRLMREIRRVAEAGKLPPAAAKMFAAGKAVEELYDVEADPHEINNLADDPAYADVLQRMRRAHLDWVGETRDLGLIPEPIIAAREKNTGDRHSLLRGEAGKALMARLRQAASDSLADASAKEAMLKHTQDDDEAVRFWGATGLGNLGPAARDTQPRIRELLQDPSAAVRVAAARALCRFGQSQQALPTLTDVLEDGAQWERLYAITVLDEIDADAKPALDAMRKALEYRDGFVARGKYTVRVANRALNELLGENNVVP